MDNYNFKYIRSKRENKSEGKINNMHLYECGGNPDVLEVIDFCKKNKEDREGEFFFMLTFFDQGINAKFPDNPFTADYGLDEDVQRHIKAVYVYNQHNGYSKLSFYESNSWEGEPLIVDI